MQFHPGLFMHIVVKARQNEDTSDWARTRLSFKGNTGSLNGDMVTNRAISLTGQRTCLSGQEQSKCEDATVVYVSNAIANPPNPRDPGQYIPRLNRTNNPELQERARIALASVSNAHANAVANAVNPDLVAKTKIRGTSANQPAVPRIHVRLSKVTNSNARASGKNSGFLTIICDFYENVPFYKVVAGLVAAIDSHYSEPYAARIQVNEVMFQYVSCGAVFDPAHTSGTLGDLWRQSTGVVICLAWLQAKKPTSQQANKPKPWLDKPSQAKSFGFLRALALAWID
ncbi:hypothetical protein B0H19DRAFT_1293523 [Mycena capillaripes]|nr:hypothetical protein B0H19DRAFT_1293523 [Mycena capillaripes]